jgi:hypothetical protein
MRNKIQHIILLVIVAFSAINTNAQVDLHQKISINAQGLTVPQVLNIIERHYDFYFAYNPEHFSTGRKISVQKENVSVKQVLNEILSGQFTYKAIGDHIILRPKNTTKQAVEYTISGKVTNAENIPLDSVIIYAVKENKAVITGITGLYKIVLKDRSQYINISRPLYKDTLILAGNITNNGAIRLIREDNRILERDTSIRQMGTRPFDLSIEDVGIVKHLVDQSAIYVTKQVKVKRNVPAQISFLPGIGSDLLVHGLQYNYFSLNILAGYSKGVSGFEVGGIANIIQENVKGAQVAGIANIVNGKTNGFQISGVLNYTFGNVTGMQVSGVGNIARSQVNGFQASGVFNQNKKATIGVQASGVVNLNSEMVRGVQISGVANLIADEMHGVQISGVYNRSSFVKGLQLSGVMNYTAGDVHGAQISAVINKTKKLNGFQFGVVNIADSIEHGLQIGLFNIVKNGYRAFELTSNETYPFDFMYKTGGKRLYSIINAAVDKNEFGIGYGIGLIQPFYKSVSGSIDGIQTAMFSTGSSDAYQGKKTSIRLALNYDFKKHFGLTGGLSLNFFNPENENKASSLSDGFSFCGNSNNIISRSIQNNQNIAWIGWFVGIRL